MLNITEVRVRPIRDAAGKKKAWVSVTFDNSFVVHDLKIMENEKGLYVVMPSRKTSEGYKDIAHPVTTEARQQIQKRVIEEYNKVMKKK